MIFVQLCGSSLFRLRFRGANSCCGESGGGGAIPLMTLDAPDADGVSGGIVGLDCGERFDNKLLVLSVPPTGGVLGAACPGEGEGDVCCTDGCTEPSDTARPSNWIDSVAAILSVTHSTKKETK